MRMASAAPALLLAVALVASCSRGHPTTLYLCRACLAEDPTRCIVHDDACGGSSPGPQEARWAARADLCQSLPPAVLARHALPDGSPSVQHAEAYQAYGMNACFDWPASEFTYECSTHQADCSGIPIR